MLPNLTGGSKTIIAIEAQIVDATASLEVDVVDARGEPLSVTSSASIAAAERLKVNAGCSASPDVSIWLTLFGLVVLLRRRANANGYLNQRVL